MSVRSVEALQQYLRRLCDRAVPPDDAELLKRFVAANDREAFEMMIARHGPLVLGTARRIAGDAHDAEDVFQAVFLSLARLAKNIREGRTLPAWLHQATCRIAVKVRKNRVSRPKEPPPEPCENRDPGDDLIWREVRQALDEELQRLPERLRSPLLLCYLSGLTRDEAAKQLGWSLGTLKRRLEEGRNSLRIRLERRGIAAVGLALTVLTPEALQAAVSKSLLESSLCLIFSTEALVPATVSGLVLSSVTALKGLAMKSILAMLAAVGIGVGIYAGAGQADPPKRAEERKEGKKEAVKPAQEEKVVEIDDPLPKGSMLRFGTSRFRNGVPIATMAVSADGKMAVVANGNHWLGSARAFDLSSGRELYSLGSADRSAIQIEAVAISPDGKTIATKQDLSSPCLCIRDAATGREIRKLALPMTNPRSRNELLTYTPNGKAIAVTTEGKVVHLIDIESGDPIRDFAHDQVVFAVAFSPDGKLMAAGGYDRENGDYFARLWEVDTGKELRRFGNKETFRFRSLAFSSDGKTLASGGDDARLRLWDVDTGKERKVLPEDGYRIGSVAFAPDGKTVAAAGDSIRLYDVTTGKEKLRIDRKAICLQFTDGGKTLTGAVSGAIYRWDTATGQTLTPEAGDNIVEQILVAADGGRIVTRGQEGEVHIWDGTNGKHLRVFQAARDRGVTMSPDGRFLAWPVVAEKLKFTDPRSPFMTIEGSRIRLYDIAADQFVDRFPAFKGVTEDLAFSDGGKILVTVDHRDGTVRLWNVEAGKESRSFQAVPDAEKQQSHHIRRTVLSPDGKTLAVAYDQNNALVRGRWFGGGLHLVRLWDVATGKERYKLEGHLDYVLDMAFSADGRFLVSASGKALDFLNSVPPKSIDQVFVWDTATGKRVAALPDGLPIGASAVAFSPDGRFLATAQIEGAIQIWEVATWTASTEFKGHRDRPTALTFGPGEQLFSGSLDTTVLAWDIRPPLIATGSLETAWIDLSKRESGEAFKAEGRFLASPSAAVEFFADKIKSVEAPDAKRIRQLIADLDSDKFSEREAASKALGDLGQQAKPYLAQAAKTAKSPEVLDRVGKLLDGMMKKTPEQLRQMRAVLVLELIGDAASKTLLKKWAAGLEGALLTEEAAAALKRLEGMARANR